MSRSLALWYFAGMYTIGLPIISRCLRTRALLASMLCLTAGVSGVSSFTPYSTFHLFVFRIAYKQQSKYIVRHAIWIGIFCRNRTLKASSGVLKALRYRRRENSLWYCSGSASEMSFIRCFRSCRCSSFTGITWAIFTPAIRRLIYLIWAKQPSAYVYLTFASQSNQIRVQSQYIDVLNSHSSLCKCGVLLHSVLSAGAGNSRCAAASEYGGPNGEYPKHSNFAPP